MWLRTTLVPRALRAPVSATVALLFMMTGAAGQSPPSSQCVTSAVAGGTSDALTVPTLPCVPTTTLLILTTTSTTTTTAPTLSYPGSKPMPILRFDGSALLVGALVTNGRYLLTSNGVNWYVLQGAITGVTGTPPTTIGDIAVWADTGGSLLQNDAALRLNITNGVMNIPIVPIASPLASLASVEIGATTKSNTTREYLLNLDFLVNSGLGGAAGGNQDKAALMVGVRGSGNNAGQMWGENISVWLDNTFAVPGGHHQVSELDMNNGYTNVDATPGPAGIQYPVNNTTGPLYTYGLVVENNGHTGSAAVIAAANVTTPWLRGIGCQAGNDLYYACLFDYSNAQAAFEIYGTHTVGIDMYNAPPATLIPVRLPNGYGAIENGVWINDSPGLNTTVSLKTESVSTGNGWWDLQIVTTGETGSSLSGTANEFRIRDSINNKTVMQFLLGGNIVMPILPTSPGSKLAVCIDGTTGQLFKGPC